jgi:hypothetical protein
MHCAQPILQALSEILLIKLGFSKTVKRRRIGMWTPAGSANRMTGPAEVLQQGLRALLLVVERVGSSGTGKYKQKCDGRFLHSVRAILGDGIVA